jgi:hypothetical protein
MADKADLLAYSGSGVIMPMSRVPAPPWMAIEYFYIMVILNIQILSGSKY